MPGRGDAGPAAARKYLLESERLLFAVRRHWSAMVGAVLRYLLALTLSLLVLRVAGGTGAGQLIGGLLLLGASGWIAWQIGDWWIERFIVTDRRVLLVSGVLTRRVAIMPLRKVTDLTYERSLTGRLLGFGAFVMESAGQQQALSRVNFLPDPDGLYRQMSGLLFGASRAGDDPDEDDPDENDPPAPPGASGGGSLPRSPRHGSGPPTPAAAGPPHHPTQRRPDQSADTTTAPLPDLGGGRPSTARLPRGRREPLG